MSANDEVIDYYVKRMSKKNWEIINRTDKGIQIKQIRKANSLGIIVGIILIPFWGIGFIILLLALLDYALFREKIRFITTDQMIYQLKKAAK